MNKSPCHSEILNKVSVVKTSDIAISPLPTTTHQPRTL